MTTSIDTLAAKAERARAAYEVAERAAETARAEAEQQRAGRLAEFDRRLVDRYDEAALVAQVGQAERDLMEAVASSTIGSAWMRLQIAQMRLARQAQQTAAAAGRIGASVDHASHVANSADAEQLTRAVDQAAARVVADETDAADAAREEAGDG